MGYTPCCSAQGPLNHPERETPRMQKGVWPAGRGIEASPKSCSRGPPARPAPTRQAESLGRPPPGPHCPPHAALWPQRPDERGSCRKTRRVSGEQVSPSPAGADLGLLCSALGPVSCLPGFSDGRPGPLVRQMLAPPWLPTSGQWEGGAAQAGARPARAKVWVFLVLPSPTSPSSLSPVPPSLVLVASFISRRCRESHVHLSANEDPCCPCLSGEWLRMAL